MKETERYPLSWPFGWPRTPVAKRKRAKFSTQRNAQHTRADGSVAVYSQSQALTVSAAMDRLRGELARLGGGNILVSTNVELTTYGEPRSGRKAPDDPGVAVYFQLKGKDRVLACDKWDRVPDNIAAIAGHIDAIRRQDRYGVGTLDQAFAGYQALPPPGHVHQRPWREVLECANVSSPNLGIIEDIYHRLACQRHPDSGGSHAQMAELNAAIADARKELA